MRDDDKAVGDLRDRIESLEYKLEDADALVSQCKGRIVELEEDRDLHERDRHLMLSLLGMDEVEWAHRGRFATPADATVYKVTGARHPRSWLKK